MLEWFRRRYLDVVGSIYIYNEHRGYTAIDRVIAAVRERSPEDSELIKRIERHRADERKHYLMPLRVDRSFGHIDRFVEIMFQRPIAQLHTYQVVSNNALFERLCRVISLTEKRGFRQVEILLTNRFILSDPVLTRIFKIIHRDEPSHWSPYDEWLEANAKRSALWWERAIDSFIHSELLFIKLPFLFLNPWAVRCVQWADAAEQMKLPGGPAHLMTAS